MPRCERLAKTGGRSNHLGSAGKLSLEATSWIPTRRSRQRYHEEDRDNPHRGRGGARSGSLRDKAVAGTRKRLVLLAAPHNGDMRGLSSAKAGWWRSGTAARRSKVRLLGRVDAPLCGRPAKKQSRNEQHDAGDFGVRP